MKTLKEKLTLKINSFQNYYIKSGKFSKEFILQNFDKELTQFINYPIKSENELSYVFTLEHKNGDKKFNFDQIYSAISFLDHLLFKILNDRNKKKLNIKKLLKRNQLRIKRRNKVKIKIS